jgi:hypothetical protein
MKNATSIQINGKTVRQHVDKNAAESIADMFSMVVGRKVKRVIRANDKVVNVVTDD